MNLLAIAAIVGSFFTVKYRERLGDMLGDPEWAGHVGGIYNVIIIGAAFMFFWGVATLTGTLDFVIGPIVRSLPGVNR